MVKVPGKKEQRNLYMRIPEESKDELKKLARASCMSLDTYCSAVLQDAIKEGVIFGFVKVEKKTLAQTS
ncbi:MAG: hypothetical protein V4438_03605 [Patescibacteria group bacterium]